MYCTGIYIFVKLLIYHLLTQTLIGLNAQQSSEIDLLSGIIGHSQSKVDISPLHLNQYKDKPENLKLNSNVTRDMLELLSVSNNFTLCIQYKQQFGNAGTLLSILTNDFVRMLEIRISSSKGKLRLFYSPEWANSGYVVIKLPIRPSGQYPLWGYRPWSSLCIQYTESLQYSTPRVNLIADCQKIVVNRQLNFRLPKSRFRKLSQKPDRVAVWIGRRGIDTSLFEGTIKRMVISNNSEYSQQFCQSLMMVSDKINPDGNDALLKRIKKLEENMESLEKQIKIMERSMTGSSSCQCLPECKTRLGLFKKYGDEWTEGPCRFCTCTLQGTSCVEKTCPSLSCKQTVKEKQQCCPRCVRDCMLRGKQYKHGQKLNINCLRCICEDGSMQCDVIDPNKECPKLTCPISLQYRPKDKCCKVCKELDMCIFSNCCPNSRCQATSNNFKCVCKKGYQYQLGSCQDINECEVQVNNKTLCPQNTVCINKPGSYECRCQPGYEYDLRTKECFASCPYCIAKSKCVAPNLCECLPGWTGSNCDLDINECKTGLINCPVNSHCVNLPGSYTCRCNLGYNSTDTIISSTKIECLDIDECARSINVCRKTDTCINIPGGYRCIPNFGLDFSLITDDCIAVMCDGKPKKIKDRSSLLMEDSCKQCQCNGGALTCRPTKCPCKNGQLNVKKQCCPYCHGDWQCPIESLHFTPQHCKNMSCSPVTCLPIKPPSLGQCCPSCNTDLENICRDILTSPTSGSVTTRSIHGNSCITQTRMYPHNTIDVIQKQQWGDKSCLQCLCWDGTFCCKKSYNCHK